MLTLESRRNGAREFKAGVDSGADPRTVVGAAAFIGPQRTTRLKAREPELFSKYVPGDMHCIDSTVSNATITQLLHKIVSRAE